MSNFTIKPFGLFTKDGIQIKKFEPTESAFGFPETRAFACGDKSNASLYLAYCILREETDPSTALAMYGAFHRAVIEKTDFVLTFSSEQLAEWISNRASEMRVAPIVSPGKPLPRISIPELERMMLNERFKSKKASFVE